MSARRAISTARKLCCHPCLLCAITVSYAHGQSPAFMASFDDAETTEMLAQEAQC